MDHRAFDLRISSENYAKVDVDAALFQALFKWISENPNSRAPIFETNERFRGYIVINCDGGSSIEFLKMAIKKMGKLWKGAELAVMGLHEIPALPKLYAPVPLFVEDVVADEQFGRQVLTVLRGQNPDIPTAKWSILRIGKVIRKSVLITFAVDKESFAVVEENNFRLSFVRNKLTVGYSRGGRVADEVPGKEEEIENKLRDTILDHSNSEDEN